MTTNFYDLGVRLMIYPLLKILHVVSAGLWLSLLIYGLIIRSRIKGKENTPAGKELIMTYVSVLNPLGIIGSMGILITGIILSIQSGMGFFQFASGGNHWLYTKQFLMVIILILVGAVMIPAAKKLKSEILPSLTDSAPLTEGAKAAFKKLVKVDLSINILIILNILLAFSRYFMGR